MATLRRFIKHKAEPAIYAVEADSVDGLILAALDVSSEVSKGGVCPHMLATLPLAGRVDDVDMLNRTADDFDDFAPECGNVHHVFADLLALEEAHRRACDVEAMAESTFRARRKDRELAAAKVHELLARLGDRKPLFEAAGIA